MKNKVRDLTRRTRRPKNKRKEASLNAKRCPHCGNVMRARGASDTIGSLSWKCKKKECGRTVWVRAKVKPPTPLVPVSYLDKMRY